MPDLLGPSYIHKPRLTFLVVGWCFLSCVRKTRRGIQKSELRGRRDVVCTIAQFVIYGVYLQVASVLIDENVILRIRQKRRISGDDGFWTWEPRPADGRMDLTETGHLETRVHGGGTNRRMTKWRHDTVTAGLCQLDIYVAP